jgi:TetR/AcrR family transcriptional regulator
LKPQDKSTEIQVLEAAKKVFLQKGFDGARMQEIADEAGINKALLHYYFRSKDKLFDAIFNDAFRQFFPKVAEMMKADRPLFEKIEFFIDAYIDMLIKNPYLPGFVLHEINRNPQRLINIIKESGMDPKFLIKSVKKEMEHGNIHKISAKHLIVNILGMCLFPFIGKPILQGFLYNGSHDDYQKFLGERKKEIKEFVLNSVRKK